jgi:hypothetical protein
MRGFRSFGSCLALSLGSAACARPTAPPPATALVAPTVVAGALDGRLLLQEPSARATEAGAGPVSIVATGELAERERTGAFVDIPDTACLLAYGRASTSVEDLDLAAFSEEGTPTAVDDAPDPHPTLLLCPPHPARVYLAAVAASGEGLVAVGAQLVPLALAPAVGKVMNAHGTRAASTRAAEAWPGLDDHVRKHHDAIGGKWEVLRKVAIAVDARMPATVAFPMETDGCTDALIVPDDDVGALEIEALDDGGRTVARGSTGARDRAVTVCSPVGWNGTLSVRPHVGQGLVAVVLSRGRGDTAKDLAERPEIAWVAAVGSVDRVRAAREVALRASGYGPATGSVTGALIVGSVRSVAATLGRARGCARIDVVGAAPTALVGASAWDESGRRLASAEGSSSATLFTCARERVRLDLDAHARPGPYVATWRPEPWADPAFDAHPIAAGRMLTRMARGEPPMLEGRAASARGFSADAGHEASWSEAIPAGECLRVVAAADGEGMGLVGRVVDATNGDEIDRGHAAVSVALRACAPEGGPRPVIVSIVATAGKLDVVVGERLVR